MTDNQIVSLYVSKNENAINETKSKYNSFLLFIAMNVLHSKEDCNEVLNDVYLIAWETIPEIKPSNLLSYLAKITRRVSITKLRKEMAHKRNIKNISLNETHLQIASNNNVLNEIEYNQLSYLIKEFEKTLNERQKTIFYYSQNTEYTTNDISALLGIKSSTIRSTLKRIKDQLREFLIKHGYNI